jgi:hypothetical protein
VNIQEMRDYIRSVVDIDSSDISNDVLNRFIGEAYDLIVYNEKRWPFFEAATTFSTVAGQKDYPLATVGASVSGGLREIAALRSNDNVITYVGRDEGDAAHPLSSVATGSKPYWWSFWADSVRLYPTPSSAVTVTVRGYRNATAFGATSGDADTPSDLPDPFHILLATYGVARAYEQQEDPQMAGQYLGIFNQEFDNLKGRYTDTPAAQPMVLNGRSWHRRSGRLNYSWE